MPSEPLFNAHLENLVNETPFPKAIQFGANKIVFWRKQSYESYTMPCALMMIPDLSPL